MYVFPTLLIELSAAVPVVLAVPPPAPRPPNATALEAVLGRSQPIKISFDGGASQ